MLAADLLAPPQSSGLSAQWTHGSKKVIGQPRPQAHSQARIFTPRHLLNLQPLQGSPGRGGGQAGQRLHPSLGQPVHAQLLLEGLQLRQADVAAPADNDHEGGQRGAELPLSLQLLNHMAVDGGQGCPTGRLYQDLLIICQRRGLMRVGSELHGVQGNYWAIGKLVDNEPSQPALITESSPGPNLLDSTLDWPSKP